MSGKELQNSSLLRREHPRAARFGEVAMGLSQKFHQDTLLGTRSFGWPLMALQVQSSLGPCRHALSQMVVAGTMTVFPPFMSTRPGNEQDKGGSSL